MDLENKYGTLEVQKELLHLLNLFDIFCSQKGISYSLSGGTLLGAIRENGFIPWDDDLDVMLDRKNYQHLVTELNNCEDLYISYSYWIYRITLRDKEGEFSYMPTLDVFVIDNVPDFFLLKKSKLFLIKILQGMMKTTPDYKKYGFGGKIMSFITHCMGYFFSENRKRDLYNRISMVGDGHKSKCVTCYNTLYKYLHLEYNADLMDKIVKHRFENINVSIISEYDHYLSTQYGDYMNPPIKAERVPQHMKN